MSVDVFAAAPYDSPRLWVHHYGGNSLYIYIYIYILVLIISYCSEAGKEQRCYRRGLV